MKRLTTIILGLSLFSSVSVYAVVAFNNVGTADHVATNTYSAPFSVTAGGSNLAVFAAVTWDGDNQSGTVASITYGGQTMTSCGTKSQAGTNSGEDLQWFYLTGPPTGPNTLAITITGTPTPTEIYVNMISFTGVDQTTPVRSGSYGFTVSSTAATNTFTEAINSATTDLTVSAISDDTGISGTNQTQKWSNITGVSEQYGDMATTAATSVTHTWTFATTGATFVWAGFSVQAAGTTASAHTITTAGSAGSISTAGSAGSISTK